MKKYLLVLVLYFNYFAHSQSFNQYFEDETIRLDYIFSGNSEYQQISVDAVSSFAQWAGRRSHLNELVQKGNGQICIIDLKTKDTLYAQPFSSLFQEWICQEQAKHTSRAFENTFLVPKPKQTVQVSIQLMNNHQKVICSLTHLLDPNDILIERKNETPNHTYLWKSGDYKSAIDVAIIAEGYTLSEKATFIKDAQKAVKAILSHEPFKILRNKFNFVAVWTPSKQSGVSIPRQGIWKNTTVNAHFDTFYSDRYLTTRQSKKIHNAVAGIPYEHIIILANTETYGGGGIYNALTLTTSHHTDFEPVVVHEFGHSFGGLADEYAYTDEPSQVYPYEVEPWEQNITTLVNFSEKWEKQMPKNTQIPTPYETNIKDRYTKIGLYQGAGYSLKGIYRPASDCRMRTNEASVFCPICQQTLEKIIHFYTD